MGNNTGIEVPADVLLALESRKAAVRVSVNGYRYRSTVGSMGGKALLPFSAEHRNASGIKGGDPIEVMLEKDEEPRIFALPSDMEAAFQTIPGSRQTFDALSPSKRKARITSVEEAKSAETRAKRIEKVLKSLSP
ncbi:MAG: hypothetical protein JWQ22_3090 [Devosia sp.]|nr:hypothetical protein [Devosia sp.]